MKKWLRTNELTKHKPASPLANRLSKQSAGRLPFLLCQNLRKLEPLPSQTAEFLTRPQTAEQLSGWEGGNQGKAAKEKSKKIKSK